MYLIGIFNKLSCINTSSINILLRIYRHFFLENTHFGKKEKGEKEREEKRSLNSLVFKAIYQTMKNPKKLET